MRVFGLLLLLALTATGGIAFYNWQIFITPNELSLGFTTVQFPLGLILLGILALVTILFLLNILYLQSSTILESRRHFKELEASKELVNKAETSRFMELKNCFADELSKQTTANEGLKNELFARADLIESNFQVIVEQLENTLDAYIGELEDRLERTKGLTFESATKESDK